VRHILVFSIESLEGFVQIDLFEKVDWVFLLPNLSGSNYIHMIVKQSPDSENEDCL
jgi:hypothetical protein